MEKLKSRKLWVTMVAGFLVTLGTQFGIDLDSEQMISLGMMVLAYVGGQSVVDRAKVIEEGKDAIPHIVTGLVALGARVEALEAE